MILMQGFANAGTRYEVSCSESKCGFSTAIGLGGGFKFEQASGWCTKCGKMASTTWKRGTQRKPAFVRFWDALTGRERGVFNCDECKSPVGMIEQIEDFKHCPKCGKASLKHKGTMMYD